MVDINHTTQILENLATQTSKAPTSNTDRKENQALDSQFDAVLDELQKESVSEIDNALADELVEESENTEMAMMSGNSDIDEDEAFNLNYGIHGRKSGGDKQRDEPARPDDDINDEEVDEASHDAFELAVHAGGKYDVDADENKDRIAEPNPPINEASTRRNPDDPTVFDLVPMKKHTGEQPGEAAWASEFSLEEIFQDVLGEGEQTVEDDIEVNIEDDAITEVASNNNDTPPNPVNGESRHEEENVDENLGEKTTRGSMNKNQGDAD